MNQRRVDSDTGILLSALDPFGARSAAECLQRAQSCNHLAKMATGATRRKLYRLKDRNLRQALSVDANGLVVSVDHDSHFGLLSISSRETPSIRLHSHENWLASAAGKDEVR